MYKDDKGVIVKKSKYGLFVDFGLHFHCSVGPILSLLSINTQLTDSPYYDKYSTGDDHKSSITDYINGLKDGQIIKCELTKINEKKAHFMGKLLTEDIIPKRLINVSDVNNN